MENTKAREKPSEVVDDKLIDSMIVLMKQLKKQVNFYQEEIVNLKKELTEQKHYQEEIKELRNKLKEYEQIVNKL